MKNPIYGSNAMDDVVGKIVMQVTSANLNATGVKGAVMAPVNGKVVGLGVVSTGDPGAAANKVHIAINGGTQSTAYANIKNGDAVYEATSATKFVKIADNNVIVEGDIIQLKVATATSNAVAGNFVIIIQVD